MSMICYIINSLQANPGPVFSICNAMWKLETYSVYTLRMDFTVNKETSCVQQGNFRNEQNLHTHTVDS